MLDDAPAGAGASSAVAASSVPDEVDLEAARRVFDRGVDQLNPLSGSVGGVADGTSVLGPWSHRWTVISNPTLDDPWVHLEPAGTALVDQGWKLHVTATEWNLGDVIARVEPVLHRHRVPWKVVPNETVARSLNLGEGGVTQIGKIITVYPTSATSVAGLAADLDRALADLSRPLGPTPPSDRPVAAGSPVSYRYGVIGAATDTLRSPGGDMVADDRRQFAPPSWAEDPIGAPPDVSEQRLWGDRFLVTERLASTPRGWVDLAVDLEAAKTVVVKCCRARRSMAPQAPDAPDARDLGRHEAHMLSVLAAVDGVPDLIDLVESDEVVAVVVEHVEGETLERIIGRHGRHHEPMDRPSVLHTTAAIARLVGAVHAQDVVVRDLSPANIVVTPEGKPVLIDLELGWCDRSGRQFPTIGTRGYASPQQVLGSRATPADDVWSFGACLYALATASQPGLSADPFGIDAAPLGVLRPDLADVAPLVRACLDLDPERRPSMADLVRDLDELARSGRRRAAADPRDTRDSSPDGPSAATPGPDLAGLHRSLHHALSSLRPDQVATLDPTVYTGLAGSLLALVATAGEDTSGNARGLCSELLPMVLETANRSEAPGNGLLVGDASLALASAVIGRRTQDPALLDGACELRAKAMRDDRPNLDVLSGAAGRLLADLWMDALLGEQTGAWHRLADLLLERSLDGPAGVCWPDEGGTPFLGYAHGAAGIAHALLQAWKVDSDERLLDAARGAAQFLAGNAERCADGRCALFPDRVGGRCRVCGWCHGSAGVADLLVALLPHDPDVSTLMRASLDAVRLHDLTGRTPSPCCGIAAGLETMLDAWMAGVRSRADAVPLECLLRASVVRRGDAVLAIDEIPSVYMPSLYRGYGGILVTLQRASHVEPVVRLMSAEGLLRAADGTWARTPSESFGSATPEVP